MRTALLLLAACGIVLADDDHKSTKLDNIRTLELKAGVDFAVLEFLRPTNDQMKKLIPLCAKLQKLQTEYREKQLGILKEQEVAYKDFRDDDIKNIGLDPKLEKRAGQAEHKGKEAMKRFCENVNEVEAEIAKLLTNDQRDMLQNADVSAETLGKYFRARKKSPDGKLPSSKELLAKKPKNSETISELEEIRAKEYGAVGGIGRLFMQPTVLELFCKISGEKIPEGVDTKQTAPVGSAGGD